jgi:hypothetical protein
MSLPLSASDLIAIARALEPIETNPVFTDNAVIGRIEVIRPDGGGDVVGYFVREGDPLKTGESWFGYVTGGES